MTDKSTMEGVLTYDSLLCETAEDHLIQQSRCLKEACMLMDKVLENYKECMEKLQTRLEEQININNLNVKSMSDITNHLLARIEVLEDKKTH